MSWDDIEEILFEGTQEQIDSVKCPECGGSLRASYFAVTRNMEIRCKECGTTVRSHGISEVPNFAKTTMATA